MPGSPAEDPFVEYPVIGRWSVHEKARLLMDIGDEQFAHELRASLPAGQTKSIFRGGLGLSRKPRPWEHTNHSFGFLPASKPSSDPMPLLNAGQIEPDGTLRGTAVTIRLDKLQVADYPGTGTHRVLFDFYARNALEDGDQEHLHYNATFRAVEGQEAAAVGLPIFVNLNVGDLGLAFRCLTVNVSNDGSQKALDMLESDLVKSGLELAKRAQPAIGPLSQIALGLTKSILGANTNVPVQDFQLGLDLDTSATGARLAEGSYFAVQVDDTANWDWSHWLWHPGTGRLVGLSDPHITCPFNYLVFRVSRQPTK